MREEFWAQASHNRGATRTLERHGQRGRARQASLPVYMIPLISTDMLILLLPLVLVRFAAESWRLSEAVGRRKNTLCHHKPAPLQ